MFSIPPVEKVRLPISAKLSSKLGVEVSSSVKSKKIDYSKFQLYLTEK